ncbi:MAG TPA: non-homologous end-joining DNA ligase [Acidimicrobiales bacterium]|nr:non-homologous end-joining DNA ligase [Acidimicrobiales bacterium]
MPPRSAGTAQVVEIEGRRLRLSNLDKVLYPETGTTKAEVIDYYARIAPVMVPHLAARGVTLRRFPDGVTGGSFFEKRCPGHRPEWVGTQLGPGDRSGDIGYCRLDSTPALVWAANMAALEIHAPMAQGDVETPTMCVFDLDPGEGTGMRECADVALDVRHVLDGFGLEGFPKTSGSKGMQVYVPLNTPHTHAHTSSFAQAVAALLERAHPGGVVSNMKKSLRRGKVLVDWSQNSRHKTTIAVYSLRARPRPTVSTPVAWDEVEAAAGGAPLSFEMVDVLARVDDAGDLFAGTLTIAQSLPDAPARNG